MITLLLIGLLLLCVGIILAFAEGMSTAPSMDGFPVGGLLALIGLAISFISGVVMIWRYIVHPY